MRPAKPQISLGIRPVWSESPLSAWRNPTWVPCYPLSAQWRLIGLGGCPGWSESSLGAQVILLVLSCCGSADQMCSLSMRSHYTFILNVLNIFGYCSSNRSRCNLSIDKLSPLALRQFSIGRQTTQSVRKSWYSLKTNIDYSSFYYRNFPKYSDTQKICCNHSKILTMWLYHRVMNPNDADGMANSVDPDQTASVLVCPDLSVRKLRIITVFYLF